MNHSAIAVRYAKALFMLAREKNIQGRLKTDMEQIMELSHNSEEFMQLLKNPLIKTSEKQKLMDAIFKGRVEPLTLDFLHLIVKNKREAHLPATGLYFLELVRKDQNIRTATLITAAPAGADTMQQIKSQLEEKLKANIELNNQLKPDIIGGLVLRLSDRQFDASIATQLKKIKEQLLQPGLN